MPSSIRIIIGDQILDAELNDSSTAKAIAKSLPITFAGDYWGDEIYGTIPVSKTEENPVAVIEEPGTLGYWPIGKAFCIFWGPTPVSQRDEIRPASPVNVIGRVISGLDKLVETRPDLRKIFLEAK
ncbi:MAG: cyclophilin-like fold protein [Candidatus Electryonea clarkiae]|nr:cyclophilin-like fold protein [Candidatus Electryonea clarkiae]MDP8285277.1 cyclophilin-like fold protein [Candidatus Electryonea clarkiae]